MVWLQILYRYNLLGMMLPQLLFWGMRLMLTSLHLAGVWTGTDTQQRAHQHCSQQQH